MRTYINLSDAFFDSSFAANTKKYSLPYTIPFVSAPSHIVFEAFFTPPEDSDQNCFFIELKSLSGFVTLFCNSKKVFAGKRLYTDFCVDLTENVIQKRKNLIKIEVTPFERADGNFSFGDAKIIVTDKAHFGIDSDVENALGVKTVFDGLATNIYVDAKTVNSNNYDIAAFSLYGPRGELIETKTEKPTAAETKFTIVHPEYWDGQNSPALYTVTAQIIRDSVCIDKISTRFGIKNFCLDSEGFFLLNGLKNPLCGVELTDFCDIEADFKLLHELDANAVFMSGLPADDDILTRCDNDGILVWLNLPVSKDCDGLTDVEYIAKNAFKHPSLAVISTNSADTSFVKEWCKIIKFNSQLVMTSIFSNIFENESVTDAVPDILAVKIPKTTELSDFIKYENTLIQLNEFHPEFRFAVFADAPEGIAERNSGNAQKNDSSQEYFCAWHEKFWNTFCNKKNVTGVFAGHLSDRDEKINRSGLTDRDREVKKDIFWFYRAQFSANSTVKLCSAGKSLVASKRINIKCYSNTNYLKLSVNGKENKKYTCEKQSECVYVYKNVKLKHKNNIITVTCSNNTDSQVIYRSRSRLYKK